MNLFNNIPESVQEQTARLAAEEQARVNAESRRTIEERAAKPLTGSCGDIGQKDLFGNDDLLAR